MYLLQEKWGFKVAYGKVQERGKAGTEGRIVVCLEVVVGQVVVDSGRPRR